MRFLRERCPAWLPKSLIAPLALLAGFAVISGTAGVVFRASLSFWWYYLPYNMFLAGLPLMFACGILWLNHRGHRLPALPLWLLWFFSTPMRPIC